MKKIVNYALYEGKEVFDRRLDNPDTIIYMNKVLSMAKADGHLYDVVFTDRKEQFNNCPQSNSCAITWLQLRDEIIARNNMIMVIIDKLVIV